MATKKKTAWKLQRRQCVIEELAGQAVKLTLRWAEADQNAVSQNLSTDGMTIEQAKRYCCVCQLGREVDEVAWTFNEVAGLKVWYSDTFITDFAGNEPTDAELAEYRCAR